MNPKYPLFPEGVVEISGAEKAKELAAKGYAILCVHSNRFIIDDGKFDQEFVYSMAKPLPVEETDE